MVYTLVSAPKSARSFKTRQHRRRKEEAVLRRPAGVTRLSATPPAMCSYCAKAPGMSSPDPSALLLFVSWAAMTMSGWPSKRWSAYVHVS